MHQRAEHPPPRARGEIALPEELPYRLESLAAASAFVYIWGLPDFQLLLARQIEDEPDLQVQTLVRELGLIGPLRPSEVAVRFSTSRSNASKILGRALDRGLVERQQDSDDARSALISLTPRGEHMARRTFEVGDAMMAELTAEWSEADIRHWVSLTRRLSAATAAYARARSTRWGPG